MAQLVGVAFADAWVGVGAGVLLGLPPRCAAFRWLGSSGASAGSGASTGSTGSERESERQGKERERERKPKRKEGEKEREKDKDTEKEMSRNRKKKRSSCGMRIRSLHSAWAQKVALHPRGWVSIKKPPPPACLGTSE